jgi:hypothetical protein
MLAARRRPFGLDAQVIGHHLGEGRLVTLAVRARAGDRGHCTRALHAHDTTLPPQRGRLDVRREPDADQIAATPPLGLSPTQPVVVGGGQRAIEG